MGINWNDEQLMAIDTMGKNILVSAAAGSGKTAVLVERIKRLVIDKKVPLDRFLIVTFTKAAASEMKEKIVKALNEEALKDGADREFLKMQLDMVPNAAISTFNSFALDVIRKYFYLTDVEPGFKVCDEDQSRLMMKEAIDAVFLEHFEQNDEPFAKFIGKYASERHEEAAKDIVLSLYTMIMSLPNPFEWLEEKTNALDVSNETFAKSEHMKLLVKQWRDCASRVVDNLSKLTELLDDGGCPNLLSKYEPYYESCKDMDFDNMDFAGFKSFFSMDDFPRLVTTKDEKENLDEIKEQVKSLKDMISGDIKKYREAYFDCEFDELVLDIKETYESSETLKNLVKEFALKFRELKDEKHLLDFSDHEHYALAILDNEEVASEYRERFEYIFIDEYQDSNDIQEALIDRIKRDDNLFMVGDVKQSIYKFRLAEPEIFMSKYIAYEEGNDKNLRIDLSRNFRSKGRILDGINDIFLDRMEGYGEAAALKKGVNYDGELDKCPELIIIDNKEEGEAVDETGILKAVEIEAAAAAEIIRNEIGKKIFNDNEGVVKTVSYKDIVILLRSTKFTASIYQDVLESMNIPCYADNSDGFFNRIEISQIIDMLSITDNAKQDIPLISVLYSPVFSFTSDELGRIRIEGKRMPFYKAFNKYQKEGSDETLKNKCIEAASEMKYWRKLSEYESLPDFVWHIIFNTGYYSYVGALPAGNLRQANLRALSDRAKQASAKGIFDLYDFLKYVESMQDGKIDIGQMKTLTENDDVVRIMTVHKSKGLEFPIVIAGSIGKRFNLTSKNSNISMHKRLGYSLVNVNREEHWKRKNAIGHLIDEKTRAEFIEEEKRILYVNLTRAKDRLYILGTKKGISNDDGSLRNDMGGREVDPLSFIYPMAAISDNINITIKDMEDIRMGVIIKNENKMNIETVLEEDINYGSEIDRRLSFEYGFRDDTLKKYKYSVTELTAPDKFVGNRLSLKDGFSEENGKISALVAGTVNHKVMENISFEGETVENTIAGLVAKNILTENEAKAVDVDKIGKFMESDIGMRIRSSDYVMREQPFTLKIDDEGTEVMVQGVIDCCFLEDDGFVVVDYKNTSVSKSESIKERYQKQLDIYAKAIEEITGKKVKEKYIYLLKQGETIRLD